MTKTYFFWGVYEGNEGDEMWKTLHEHFEKLASKTNDGKKEAVVSDKKTTRRK
jgi:hypothetical protein